MKKHLLSLCCVLFPFFLISQTIIKGSAIQRENIPFVTDVHSGGTVEYRLSPYNTSGRIRKPLIVAEGFDVSVIMNENFNADLESFLRPNRIGTIDVSYPNDNGNLLDDLDLAGYDIIYLDYKNGIDDIWRNAKLFRQVIEWVNANKQGNEPNVVMGISMGGLVARIALRQMEIDGIDHQTRMYISMDSPHKGANIPIGLQSIARHMYRISLLGYFANILDFDDVEVVIFANYLLYSTAARQMLNYTIDELDVMDNSIHNTFQQQYDQLGFPQQNNIVNIAISNGSNNGNKIFEPGSAIVSGSFLRIDDGNLVADIDVHALNNMRASEVYKGTVYAGSGTFFITIPWGVGEVYSTADMFPIDGAPGGAYSLDVMGINLPSGLAEAVKQPKFCFVPTVSALALSDWESKLTQPLNTGQITSPFSSIFTQDSNELHTRFNSSAGFLRDHLIGAISGDTVIYGSANFTIANGNATSWTVTPTNIFTITHSNATSATVGVIASNLTGQTGTLTAVISGVTITKPIHACSMYLTEPLKPWLMTDYKVVNAPDNAIINWVMPAGIACSPCTGASVTLRPTGSICKVATVQANVTDPATGYQYVLSKNFAIGSPPDSYGISTMKKETMVPYGTCDFIDVARYISIDGQSYLDGITAGEWRSKNGDAYLSIVQELSYDGVPGGSARIKIGNYGFVYAQVRLENQCGWSDWTDIKYLKGNACPGDNNGGGGDDCDGVTPIVLSTYPNPATAEVMIWYPPTPCPERQNQVSALSVSLLDKSGKVQRKTKFGEYREDKGAESKLDVSTLKEGTYYLHVEGNGKIHKEQIMVKKK